MGPIQFGHGYRSLHLRDDFGYVQELGLDAPVYLPRGSHRVNIIHETGSRWFFTDGFTHHRELL
jgi:hypothetical protein